MNASWPSVALDSLERWSQRSTTWLTMTFRRFGLTHVKGNLLWVGGVFQRTNEQWMLAAIGVQPKCDAISTGWTQYLQTTVRHPGSR